GVEGVGDRRAHLARGGRQRRDRRDGHVVRRASHPGGGRRGRAAACEAMTRLPDLVSALERGGLLVGTPDLHTWPEITGLTADSRRIEPGMLYCAVRGSAQDGHQFVAAARERGAGAALVEREQPVGLPQVPARGARGAAMEVSSHSLDQGRVEGLVFRTAVFTNLTREHLDYHHTLEDYFKAKAKLAGYLGPTGLEVVNADDPAWLRLPHRHRRVTFGEREGSDVSARKVVVDGIGARFDLITPTGSAAARLPLLGRFNVTNALGVAACAWGMGVPVEAIVEQLATAPQVPGRMERIAERPCTILRDYSHKPDALERALESVRPLTSGRIILVFGAGGDRDRGKRAPMGEIAVRLADVAIVTSDNP